MSELRTVAFLAATLSSLACSSGTVVDTRAANVAAIVVDPPASTIVVGSELPLQAQVQDETGALVGSMSITWSVRDSAVASVSTSGVVSALAPGTTQVAANANGRSGVASITVQKVPVASVAVRPSRAEVVAGGRVQLIASVYDAAQNALADRPASWSSSNPAVATVDAAGMVSAIAAGTAVVTGTSEGKSESATVVVSAGPVASVSVEPSSITMNAGQTTQLAVTTRDAAGGVLTGRSVVWSSANTAVALVSATGVVSAVSAGSATITATSEGKSGATMVSVAAATSTPVVPPPAAPPPVAPAPVVPASVATVSLTPSTPSVAPKQSITLAAVTRDAAGVTLTGRTVSWTSSNQAIARVSGDGVVTGVANGAAMITATSEGRTATVTVTVQPGPATRITVTPATATVKRGRSVQLTATAQDAFGNVVTGRPFAWKSSDAKIAAVSSSGAVTGDDKKTGTATITATLDGSSAQAVITVTQ